MDDRVLISSAIKASGKSVRRFAREDLVRDPRTVWRWLAGENPLPQMVREACTKYLVAHPLPPDADASAALPADEDDE